MFVAVMSQVYEYLAHEMPDKIDPALHEKVILLAFPNILSRVIHIRNLIFNIFYLLS